MESRTQFTFYESFFKAASRMKSAVNRAAFYDAVCSFALYGTEPDMEKLPESAASAFEGFKATLEASRRKSRGARAARTKNTADVSLTSSYEGEPKIRGSVNTDTVSCYKLADDTAKIPAGSMQDTAKIPPRCDDDISKTDERYRQQEKDKEKDKDKEQMLIPPYPPLTNGTGGGKDDRRKTVLTQIVDGYHRICKTLPPCKSLSRSCAKEILEALNGGKTVENFLEAFRMAEESGFLHGNNRTGWIASFDWMVKQENLSKILNGNYANGKLSSADRKNAQFIQPNAPLSPMMAAAVQKMLSDETLAEDRTDGR